MSLFPGIGRLPRWVFLMPAIALAMPTPGNAATAFTTVRVNVVKPMAFAEVSAGINFGTIMANGVAGRIALSPSGAVTSQGVTVADRDQVSSGSFKLFGAGNQAYTISLPDAVTFAKGADVISVGAFTHDAGETPTLDPDGYSNFNIGATLQITKGKSSGTYYGSVPIIISNN